MKQVKLLRLPALADAQVLFPLIYRTRVVDNIAWDGPASEEEWVTNWAAIVAGVEQGCRHFFVICEPSSRAPIGCCDVRPDAQRRRGTVGIWIGERYQQRGFGTRAVAELIEYAWDTLQLARLEAEIFVDNWQSRRVFEKHGFVLQSTTQGAQLKAGVSRDDWNLVLFNPNLAGA